MQDDDASRAAAQRRIDRMRAFDEELAALERDGVLRLPDEDRARLDAHRAELLASYRARFDVDVSDRERQTSWAMRITATLGALALTASVFLLFYRYWGALSTPLRVAVLLVAPFGLVAATEAVARRERGRYFTGLLAALALGAFVLELNALGEIFALTPTQHALLAWSALAVALAYAYELRLLLAAGLVTGLGWLLGSAAALRGIEWTSFAGRPEEAVVGGALVAAVPFVLAHPRRDGFPVVYRLVGAIAAFVALLVLAHWGRASYLPLGEPTIEAAYQVAGFAIAGLTIRLGIRRRLPDLVYAGATFFVILLYTKLVDWWWDWMPKYLFFLLLGAIALAILWLLGRARRAMRVAA